ncbi:hypothetical protein [Streptococcus porcorum]|uniref:Drug/metabolite transporter (DMT)-like permease n=1 Tax=Streptococcus porcorum TaxID=701526 RepID=A0ABV2JFV9_9STRE
MIERSFRNTRFVGIILIVIGLLLIGLDWYAGEPISLFSILYILTGVLELANQKVTKLLIQKRAVVKPFLIILLVLPISLLILSKLGWLSLPHWVRVEEVPLVYLYLLLFINKIDKSSRDSRKTHQD